MNRSNARRFAVDMLARSTLLGVGSVSLCESLLMDKDLNGLSIDPDMSMCFVRVDFGVSFLQFALPGIGSLSGDGFGAGLNPGTR